MVKLFEIGAYKVMCKHIQLKGSTWYYRRRIPEHARRLHKGKKRNNEQTQLFFSLKTSDKAEAARLADSETRRFDALWRAAGNDGTLYANPNISIARLEAAGLHPGDAIRHPDLDPIGDFIDDLIGQREPNDPPLRVSPQDQMTLSLLHGNPIPRTLSDAKDKHFELGKGPKNKIAEQQFYRAWNLLLEVAGDVTLDMLRREHGNEFIRRLVKSNAGLETIKRYLSQVRPVIETGIREFELKINNQLIKLTIPIKNEGPRKPRYPYSMPELEAIQARCREVNDERRWAIAMLSDTGARLAEVAGLRKEDVVLEHAIPHIRIEWTEDRRLKNKSSVRLVPLVGEALWAAENAMQTSGPFLFPVFQSKTPGKDFNANTASATLNKWQRENGLARSNQTIHSFRHTMRDRLRDVETPSDVADRIGGWQVKGVGESYGQGHGLEVLQKYLLRVVRQRVESGTTNPKKHR